MVGGSEDGAVPQTREAGSAYHCLASGGHSLFDRQGGSIVMNGIQFRRWTDSGSLLSAVRKIGVVQAGATPGSYQLPGRPIARVQPPYRVWLAFGGSRD